MPITLGLIRTQDLKTGTSMGWIASQNDHFGLNFAQMAPGGAESDSDQIFLILSVCDPMDLVCFAEITYPAYWYHNQSMAYVYVLKF